MADAEQHAAQADENRNYDKLNKKLNKSNNSGKQMAKSSQKNDFVFDYSGYWKIFARLKNRRPAQFPVAGRVGTRELAMRGSRPSRPPELPLVFTSYVDKLHLF